jgi:patatin-like phospholipase/acyl hydrolase
MKTFAGEGEIRPFRILSLDGGGIRGAFAAGYLAEIERVIGGPIGDYFDLIAGTSTGGIIAASIAYRIPASTIEHFYREQGPRIFCRRWRSASRWPRCFAWLDWLLRRLHRPPLVFLDMLLFRWIGVDSSWVIRAKYGHAELSSALAQVFSDQTLGQAMNRLLIPSINVKRGQIKVFKTAHLPYLYIDRDYKVSEVIRATTAAPSYFEHATITKGSAYVDGGLWANNPTMAAIVESMAIAKEGLRPELDGNRTFGLETTFALSIGTGYSKFLADPPGTWAGLAWWNPGKLLSLISLSQSQGAQFQASFLLGKRLRRVEFELPHGDWSLDNVKYVNEMIERGRERAAEDIQGLRAQFFSEKAPVFHAFPHLAKPADGASTLTDPPTSNPPPAEPRPSPPPFRS